MDTQLTRNIEIVKSLYKEFAQRNIPEIINLLDPDLVWGEPDNPFNPAGGTRHGLEGFISWLRIGHDAEDILKLEPRQFLANENSVAVVGYTECLVKTTGKRYTTDFVHLVTLQESKIIKFQEFFDTFAAAEAFKA